MKTLIRLTAVVAAVVVQSFSSFASDIGGITNIHVNAFVPYKEVVTGKAVGNASMWLAMSEDGLAKRVYRELCQRGVDAATNSVPDVLFPSNTVAARVWRGHAAALTNAYNLLTADAAKMIIDPEVVNLLTNFGPLVKSVTRGVGSATIPYVDADGNQQFGKAIVLGCEKNDWTAYNIISNELSRIGDGYEEHSYTDTRRYIVTNSTVKILGSRTPSVAFGSLGYVIISSSEEIWAAVEQAAVAFGKDGTKPFYDSRRALAKSGDDYLIRKSVYTRPFKTEGFERYGYAILSSRYQLSAAKMLGDYGFNPELAGTNTTFNYLATLCSEECGSSNSRMRIDIQGSKAALRTIGATQRLANLFLVNAGLLDEDFMTFDEDWVFDRDMLEQIAVWAKDTREKLGLGGLHCWFDEGTNRVTSHMNLSLSPDGFLRRLFCADEAGKGEKNLCAIYLPTNAVAAFTFQPDAAAWTELNRRLFSLIGQKSEILDQLFDAFASHPNSFGKSAAVGLLPNSGFFSAIKIEDENLWYSIRILLEQFGGEAHVSARYPENTVIVFPYFHITYDRLYKVIRLESGAEAGTAAAVASRDLDARLINSLEFRERMGLGEGEGLPNRNALVYLAPACDTALHEKLEQELDVLGLGALKFILQHGDLSKTWLCGYGAYGEDGLFRTEAYMSTNVWTQGHRLMEAAAKTIGQVMAAAYPYDASKARVFEAGDVTLHVSRADNWDDVNGRLYHYEGKNVRVRIVFVRNGKTSDKTHEATLDKSGLLTFQYADGSHSAYYLTSEGIFGSYDGKGSGCFIGRLAPEIEPELSVLPSAEEVAEQVKKIVDAIGIESVTVGAAKSDDRTGPFGEPTVIRKTTIVPVKGGGLDQLIAKVPDPGKTRPLVFMPSNTVFGSTLAFAEGALTNAIAAIKYAQPELMEYFEKLFGGFGFDKEIVASVKDALALGLAKEEEGLEPYFVVRLNRGQRQHWVDLTNRLYTTTGVTVTDFQTSQFPDTWEAIAFTREDALSGRTIERCYTRIFESEDRDPFFLITQNTDIKSDITARVRRAGIYGVDRLEDDKTYQSCMIPIEPDSRGHVYLAPITGKYWFFDRLYFTEDGELVIKRRTSAGVAPYEATVARFAVNFFEALRGEKSVITFENDAEADKVAEAATSNVVAKLRYMRTKLGVTGLDFYDADPDADGRYGNTELAIGTKGDGCEFLKRFAADAPASAHLVETYIPATACVLATKNAEAHYLTDDIGYGAKAVAELVGEKYPYVAAAITNYLASDSWKIIAESLRLTGSHRAFAILQDFENPFVRPIDDENYAGISAGYAAVEVFGPMESALPFLLVKQAVADKPEWKSFTTNGVEYLIRDGQMFGYDIKSYVRPTFAFDPERKVLVLATLPRAAGLAIRAGRDGENRLIDSETFADVMGFKQGEAMPAHNTLYYFAPQNDDILGCTLRRILSPYLPEGYAMLLDRPSLKGYWGGAYGVRVKDAFRIYTHAGMKGHTAFLAAAQALLKTAAEGLRVRQPYDWTESKMFRSADMIRLVEPTDETGVYAASLYSATGDFTHSYIDLADSDNSGKFGDWEYSLILSKHCIFCSSKSNVFRAGKDTFYLMFVDDEADPADYTGGVATDIHSTEWTLSAGEKINRQIKIYPSNAKITKVTNLPMGVSLKKTKDGYFLTGTPTKVGEDSYVTLTATCVGRQQTLISIRIIIGNYESDYADLDVGYDLTAGVEDSLMLTNVAGWTASGVPSGMKFDKTTGALSGTPAKPGEYVITFTKKIDGKTEKVSTVITVDQGDGIRIATGFSDKTSQIAEDGETREIYVGVKIDWPVEVRGLEDVDTTLSAKGLPSGLKLVKTTDKLTGEVSYSIQGIATKASAVDKKTGEVKPSTVVLTGTNKYKWTGEEAFDLVVKALPDWAIGTFNGHSESVQGSVSASVKVTVSSVGKVSISQNGVSPVMDRAMTDSFACTGFDSYDPLNNCFAFAIENVKWKSGRESRLTGAIGLDKDLDEIGLEVGRYITCNDLGAAIRVQQASNYNWDKWTFPTGKNQLMLDLTDEVNPGLEGLTLKFAKGGKVTVAGKVLDSETGKLVSVSASPALVAELNADDKIGDGLITASVGFVVKTKTPFNAYVPIWMQIDEDGTVVAVYESDPTKDE